MQHNIRLHEHDVARDTLPVHMCVIGTSGIDRRVSQQTEKPTYAQHKLLYKVRRLFECMCKLKLSALPRISFA